MSKVYRYDVYEVQVPTDLADPEKSPDDQRKELCQQAITQAEERAKVYALPADWSAEIVQGDLEGFEVTVRVVRKRHRKAG